MENSLEKGSNEAGWEDVSNSPGRRQRSSWTRVLTSGTCGAMPDSALEQWCCIVSEVLGRESKKCE